MFVLLIYFFNINLHMKNITVNESQIQKTVLTQPGFLDQIQHTVAFQIHPEKKKKTTSKYISASHWLWDLTRIPKSSVPQFPHL